jgi:hypothetical protein
MSRVMAGQVGPRRISSIPLMALSSAASQELLNAFREHYHRYERTVHEAVSNSADAVVLWRLGDDLNQFLGLVTEVSLF